MQSEVLLDPRIAEMTDRLVELDEQSKTILAVCDTEKRDLNDDEQKELDRILAESKRLMSDIDRRKEVAAQSALLHQSAGRRTTPDGPTEEEVVQIQASAPQSGSPSAPPVRRQSVSIESPYSPRGMWGWRSRGEYYMAVANGCRPGGFVDPRLVIRNAPTTYSSEGSGSEGGYLIPPDIRTAIVQRFEAETGLLGRTDQMTTSSNTLTMPTDETTQHQTSGGLLGYWGSEAGLMTQSKILLQELAVRLHKLYVFVPVTSELLEDTSALESYLNRKVPEKLDFMVTMAILQGSGVGQPLGILKSPTLVSVAKESGQLADTIVTENILKMYSRMYGPSRANAVWLINQDIEPQLFQMTMGTNNLPVYLPPNGLAGSPFASLLGRPVVPTQACETLGDQGDIIFADLRQYLSVLKTGLMRSDVSVHLWFDYDMVAFRFIMRIGGQPWWTAAFTPRVGNNTLSPFVTLDARA